MIRLHNIYKTYKTRRGKRKVLNDVSWEFAPGTNVGIVGRNGMGKSTLLRIIGGSELPDSGRVERRGKISWPLGFSGGFNAKISGRENLRFICRLYAEDYRRTAAFVEDFSELGEYIDMPVRTYSSGMRAKLAFGISMAFEFEFYLIDEITAVGDAGFKQKCNAFFDERRKNATLLIVSHNMLTLKSLCEKILVLHQGKLHEFPSSLEAEKFYLEKCHRRKR